MTANNSSNTSLSKIFALNPVPEIIEPSEVKPSIDATSEDDFSFARKNVYSAINTGQEALKSLASLAEQSQHPRAYEVLSVLIKTIVESNKELLDMQKKRKELNPNPNQGPSTVNNNLILTTADLQRILLGKINENGKN